MNCTVCGKPIILIPSATERAKKFGGKASDYTKLFTTHADCAMRANDESLKALFAQRKNETTSDKSNNLS